MYCCLHILASTRLAVTQENLSLVHANNKGPDQPAHLRSLISAYVIRFPPSMISILTSYIVSSFYLVSVSEQAGLGMTWSESLKTGFVAQDPYIILFSSIYSIVEKPGENFELLVNPFVFRKTLNGYYYKQGRPR